MHLISDGTETVNAYIEDLKEEELCAQCKWLSKPCDVRDEHHKFNDVGCLIYRCFYFDGKEE